MNNKSVPKATLQRYPVYLKALRKLQNLQLKRIMSRDLSKLVDIKATTIRRDFSFLGSLGKQGFGYDVDKLINTFNEQLGGAFEEKLIIVGAGNLGRALMNYNRWNHVVGEIACAFDIQSDKIGNAYEIPVYSLEKLKEKMPVGCRIAILTVSKDVQETVDILVEAGIKGIVDFTHEHIQVPKGILVKEVDVVSMIQELVFETNALS
ncbi:MAG: redox-sensing transcriptional repressor Rex [Erysipelotrichaceae bacterium]